MINLSSYFLHFLACSFAAAALAAAGAHLATRQRTLQSLCLAQGAELGALASVLVVQFTHASFAEAQTWWSLTGGLVGAHLMGELATRLEGARTSSRTPRLFSIWIILVASTHLAVASHPALESHLTRVFLGDLATLLDSEALVLALLGILSLSVLLLARKAIGRRTFDSSALGLTHHRAAPLELVPFVLLPAVSTWAAGFLFTCACLFVPTSFLKREGDSSFKSVLMCAGVAFLCGPIGLFASLRSESLPTVPTIVGCLTAACVGIGIFRSFQKRN